MRVRAAVDPTGAASFDPDAMSRPSHIYASTVRRRRPVWPYAVAAVGVLALVAAVLLRSL